MSKRVSFRPRAEWVSNDCGEVDPIAGKRRRRSIPVPVGAFKPEAMAGRWGSTGSDLAIAVVHVQRARGVLMANAPKKRCAIGSRHLAYATSRVL